ncbi:hypothetical protein SNOG_20054 [Parastagonospora nodorum SN15]|uniref:Zn(2)-C6 fungal-type domain-containing protein n=1 Tax=Phaeosphaeria nodorum (strain SN15 / ATCC MYA-4574 / FGSC 10173) TaxID=321614 RepID=A9JX46_PHANO|nr:hypothetical protein SNOG_20054 [Parastagonospora nodorum SN15]EDP89910.1 hypothetical protein SNOG_20054 [Parastagonospora nodorum SN15]
MQPTKDNRATTSCSECQRRKQRCSREWPCNHCQARKVAHLCQFGAKKAQQESPPDSNRESSNESRGQKRSFPEPSETSSSEQPGDMEEPEDGLKIWGFMPGHVHYKVGNVEDVGSIVPSWTATDHRSRLLPEKLLQRMLQRRMQLKRSCM